MQAKSPVSVIFRLTLHPLAHHRAATQKQLDGIATSVELTFVQAQLPARQLVRNITCQQHFLEWAFVACRRLGFVYSLAIVYIVLCTALPSLADLVRHIPDYPTLQGMWDDWIPTWFSWVGGSTKAGLDCQERHAPGAGG
ncbi:hypothetical protein HaLaN_21965 [Haematococcus lacustris]|uniref:Uncharacterized protein n=1 Tax=Haematococcus lacustris TaxID=44745 RepID=A0A699ZN06_HAELA|nr:hypothetical protein HaLaN_21965 [Haematococcus lacustris]